MYNFAKDICFHLTAYVYADGYEYRWKEQAADVHLQAV